MMLVVNDTISPINLKPAGDVNGDYSIDVADVTSVINVMYGATEHSTTADVNGDGVVDISDVTSVINVMFE